jgi:predicted sulfurtransferase
MNKRKGRKFSMRHRVLAALAAIVVVWSLGPSAASAEAVRMSQEDLKSRLGEPSLVLIDVRSHTDWFLSREKIKGAERENYRDFDGWAAKYPKDKTIVLYCA